MEEKIETGELGNATISEWCARKAEQVSGHLQQAFRRAARKALLWPEEAHELVSAGRSLSELDGVGLFLAHQIQKSIDKPLDTSDRPPIRQEFLALTQARKVLSRHPSLRGTILGDLHMHTAWSDGSATVAEMAHAAVERGYGYVAITDHTKGLRFANGLDEQRLIEQRHEIDATNRKLAEGGANLRILSSAEVNLFPTWRTGPVIGSTRRAGSRARLFSLSSSTYRSQTERYVKALRNRSVHILGHPKAEFLIIERAWVQIGSAPLPRLRGWTSRRDRWLC